MELELGGGAQEEKRAAGVITRLQRAVLRVRFLCARQELGVLNKRVGLAQI